MRKIFGGLLLAALVMPGVASANDIPDGRDCRRASESSVKTYANGSTEADRLAICVKGGGMTLFYFGGEMQSEDPRNDGFGRTCGAIIVADVPVASGAYGEDWDYQGGPGTADDFHC